MTDPPRCAVLRRIRRAPPAAGPGERCEMCAEPIADEHAHVVNVESRALLCTCRACYAAVHAADARAASTAPCRTATCAPSATARRAIWDELQIPVGSRSSSTTRALGRIVGVLPEPGGRHRVGAAARRLGRRASRRTRARARWSPTSRRCSSARDRRRRSSASSSRSTPATSWSGSCASCGGASTAARRRGRRSTTFFAGYGTRAAGAGEPARRARRGAVTELGSPCWTSAPEPYAAAPTLLAPARDRRDDAASRARDRAALPDPHRAAAAPLRRRRGGRPARALRRAAPLGRHAASRSCGPTPRDGARVHRRAPRSTCRCRAPTTSRSRRRSTCTRSTTASPAARCCSAGRCSPAAAPASASSRCRGTGRRLPAAGRGSGAS